MKSLALVPVEQDSPGTEQMSSDYEQQAITNQKEIISALGGIKSQIGELVKSTIRTESALISVIKDVDLIREKDREHDRKFQEMDQKIHSIQLEQVTAQSNQNTKTTLNTTTLQWISKGIWLVIGGTIAYIFSLFKG